VTSEPEALLAAEQLLRAHRKGKEIDSAEILEVIDDLQNIGSQATLEAARRVAKEILWH